MAGKEFFTCYSVESFFNRTLHVLVGMWNQFVYVPWRMCTTSPCTWWCLCCNRWLCWISLILVAILTIIFWLLYVIIIVFVVTTCETICVLLAIFNDSGRCFGNGNTDPGPGPLPQPTFPDPPVSPSPPTTPE